MLSTIIFILVATLPPPSAHRLILGVAVIAQAVQPVADEIVPLVDLLGKLLQYMDKYEKVLRLANVAKPKIGVGLDGLQVGIKRHLLGEAMNDGEERGSIQRRK